MVVNKVFCFAGEKNGVKYLKYLKINKGDILTMWNHVFNGIRYHIEKINDKKVNFADYFHKIKFVSNDLLPVGKVYFPTLIVIIERLFKQKDIFYPQVYLDDAVYQL